MSLKLRKAFTLIELLIVGLLFSFVFAAVLSLQSFVLNGHIRQQRRQMIFVQTVYSVKLISASLLDASYVTMPAAGETNGKTLLGYFNTSPLDNVSKLLNLPAAAQGYFLYCVTSDGKKVYKYTGNVPVPVSMTPFYCGKPPEATQTRELLVDAGSGSLYIEWIFSRPTGVANVVHLDYRVRSGTEEITGSADMHLQKSL
ncbi:MAG: hypothetical protein A2X28_04150 [Elusimicrobia bacterium GWA2_56_46]|nr:MAG: hypothetical protein A2X28_04150 [Elusimicrobia bacterium GWA2_56_46]OGR56069.1 MAG: hypothetical protein A2X39_07570 [Elusimicrobia bacterium GWC2_56_31]HBW22902.1 hypothetical protein [Elusimicrobiota bacterium]